MGGSFLVIAVFMSFMLVPLGAPMPAAVEPLENVAGAGEDVPLSPRGGSAKNTPEGKRAIIEQATRSDWVRNHHCAVEDFYKPSAQANSATVSRRDVSERLLAGYSRAAGGRSQSGGGRC